MFIFTFICSLFISMRKEYEEPSRFFRTMLELQTKVAVFIARIRIHVTGKEKIPQDTRFLMVGNHISNFDPILTWHVFPENKLLFITKPENFKYPFYGRIIYRCGFMAIDRKSPRNALKTIQKAAKVMKDDRFSVCVYPEGTRNKTGEGLLPFHHGALKAAQMAHVPIAVLLVRGTPQIAKRFPWRGTDVYMDVLDVIPAEEVAAAKTVELGNRIREMMLDKLSEGKD